MGKPDIRDDEISFVDAPHMPEPVLSDDPADLQRSLYASEALRDLSRDFQGARAIAYVLREYQITSATDGLSRNFPGDGSIAGFIADLRGFGEYYLDIEGAEVIPIGLVSFPYAPSQWELAAIAAIEAAGWRAVPPDYSPWHAVVRIIR